MTKRTSRRRNLLLLATVLVPVAIAAILKAYGRTAADSQADTPVAMQAASLTVSVEKIRAETIPSVVTATGTVEAWQEGTIGAEASGLRLTEVLVDEGDRVAKGDVVARLDSTLLTAQLAEQQAAVEQARATLEAAEVASARAQKLLASKAISAETAEERATTVKTSRAQLAQAQAAADRIKAELGQTEIRAAFDGIISTKPSVAGSVVQTGTELVKIIRDGRLEVAVLVPEQALSSITVGQAATVTGASGRTIEGKVSSIAEKVDSTTRLGTVRVSFGEGSGLKPGMFARVSIETAASRMLSVAESALVWRDGKPSVFVVGADGKVRARAVETSTRKDGRVAIVSGLLEGDSVVVAGACFLSNGNLVRVTAAEASVETAITSSESVQ
jgi:RND family efflux transporter MFP subunit